MKNDIFQVKYMFDISDKKDFVFLLLFTLIITILCELEQTLLLSIITIVVCLLNLYKKPYISLSTYIVGNNYIYQELGGIVQMGVLILILISMFLKRDNEKIKFSNLVIIFISLTIIIFSSLNGIEPDYSMALIMFTCVLSFVIIRSYFSNNNKISTIIFSFFLSGVSLSLTVFIDYFIKKMDLLKFGRLSINGDIKSLASAAAISLAIIIASKMDGKKVFNVEGSFFIEIICAILLITIIFLTSARGIILALILGFIIHFLFSKHKGKSMKYILLIAFASIILFTTTVDLSAFRTSRLIDFSEFGSANGRTDIWIYYIDKIKNAGFIYVLFGIGPGEIARISNTDLYAHSTFLDYFFSYGIIGFTMMISFQLYIFVKLKNNKTTFLITIFFIIVIMNLTHGIAANLTLYMIEGILLAYTEQKQENNS